MSEITQADEPDPFDVQRLSPEDQAIWVQECERQAAGLPAQWTVLPGPVLAAIFDQPVSG